MNELKTGTNYLKIFSTLSLILIVLFAISLFFLQSHSIKRILFDAAERRATSLSEQLAHIISEEFLKSHLLANNEVNMNDPASLKELDKLIGFHFKNQNINRVVLYDEDSVITYSTLHTIIGHDGSKNKDVRRALEGQISSRVVVNVEFDDLDPGSEGLQGRIIETYVPFSFKFMEQPVKGVVEIYQDLTEVEARINKLNRRFLFLVVIVSASLYILLLLITAQIDKKRVTLVKQLADKNSELEGSEKELKKYATEMESLAEERSKQLIHADRMASIGTLAAGVAHEINNPVTYISSNIQILKMFWDKSIKRAIENPEEAKKDEKLSYIINEVPKMLEDMKNGTQKIDNIVSSLRDFSGIKRSSTFKSTNICECIENAVKLCKLDIAFKHDIDVQLNLSKEIPNIMLDQQAIEQVLVNLLTNAIHAVEIIKDDKKPTVKVSATLIENEAVIEVTDNGQGMDEQTLDNIFNPFFTTKEVGKGTGLGLSICLGIIEKCRGSIKAKSTLGEGSSFIISLPLDVV